MKLSSLLKLTLGLALAAAPILPASADITDQARKVHADHEASVFGIRGIIKINATMNGAAAGNQETEIWNNGILIGKGLVMTAYRAISPDFSSQQRPGLVIESEIAELNLVDSSGEEFAAKLILHDEDLGVAFIAIDPHGEKAADFKGTPVDISKDPEISLLQELVSVGRYNSSMRFVSSLRTAAVTGIVKRPRKKYAISGIPVGQSAMTADGELVGLVVTHSEKGKSGAIAVVLPTQYIRDLMPQATEKQAELANAPAEKDETEEAEEEKSEEPAIEADPGKE